MPSYFIAWPICPPYFIYSFLINCSSASPGNAKTASSVSWLCLTAVAPQMLDSICLPRGLAAALSCIIDWVWAGSSVVGNHLFVFLLFLFTFSANLPLATHPCTQLCLPAPYRDFALTFIHFNQKAKPRLIHTLFLNLNFNHKTAHFSLCLIRSTWSPQCSIIWETMLHLIYWILS